MKKQSCSLVLSSSLILFLAACSHQAINTGLETGAIPNDEPIAAVDTASPPSNIEESALKETFPGSATTIAEQKTTSQKRVRHRGSHSDQKSTVRKAANRKIAKHKLDTRKHKKTNAVSVAHSDSTLTPPPPAPPQPEAAVAPSAPLTVPLAASGVIVASGTSDWIIWTIFGLVAAAVVIGYHTSKGRKSESWPHSHGI